MNIKSVSTIVLSSAMILGFCQCKQQETVNDQTQQETAPVAVSGLKIAVIDVDSLLANYAFYQDLAEEIMRKEENYRLALTEEANKWQKEVEEHQRKLKNAVYSSAERAQSEENRLTKKQQAIQDKVMELAELEEDNEDLEPRSEMLASQLESLREILASCFF